MGRGKRSLSTRTKAKLETEVPWDMYAYLWDRINQLEQEMETLRKENEELKKQIDTIQPVAIENLVYKIQELNVQTLSGTLNVGLTTQGEGENVNELIEKLQREGKAQFDLGEPTPSSPTIPTVDEESSSVQVPPPEDSPFDSETGPSSQQ